MLCFEKVNRSSQSTSQPPVAVACDKESSLRIIEPISSGPTRDKGIGWFESGIWSSGSGCQTALPKNDGAEWQELKTATSHVARINNVYSSIVVIHNVGVEKHNAKQSYPDAFQAN